MIRSTLDKQNKLLYIHVNGKGLQLNWAITNSIQDPILNFISQILNTDASLIIDHFIEKKYFE
jgi:hypothetical protein